MSENQNPCDENEAQAVAGGILYGIHYHGKHYLSTHHHRGTRPQKSIWSNAITRSMECCIFYDADKHNWRCSNGHYWGVHHGGETILGQDGERLCKFPCPSNESDAWHGYPVFSKDDAPPDDFVEWWINQGVISRTKGKKIQKGKL